MDAAAELGRNPVSKHQIQPEYGDEQADAGRDCRKPCLETKFSGTNADRGIFIFPVQLTTSKIGNLTRSILTVLSIYVMVTIHKADIQCIGSWVSPVLSTCPLHTNSGCGKERRILIGPW